MRILDSMPIVVAVVASFAAGCGGESISEQEAALLHSTDAALREDHDVLARRLAVIEERSRAIEERLEAIHARLARTSRVRGSGPGRLPEDEPTTEGFVSSLDTPEARARIEAVLDEIRRKEREEKQSRVKGAMSRAIEMQVERQLADELGLDAEQQSRMIAILTDANARISDIWSEMDGVSDDPVLMADAQARAEQIRQDANDEIARVLTFDQLEKFKKSGGMAGEIGPHHRAEPGPAPRPR